MPSVSVCPYCRKKCAKCHIEVVKNGHSITSCTDCAREYQTKCCVCGGKKSGPGSVGATGPGTVCGKCFKVNTCIFCNTKL